MSSHASPRLAKYSAAALAVAAILFIVRWWTTSGDAPSENGNAPSRSASVDEVTLKKLCSHCHLFPQPDILPRAAWARSIRAMAGLKGYGTGLTPPSVESIIDWYDERARKTIPLDEARALPDAAAGRWEARLVKELSRQSDPYVANVCFRNLAGQPALELLFGDMRHGQVESWKPFDAAGPAERLIGPVEHPAHIEPVDFDQDGLGDLLVANLGSFSAIDHNLGSVEWLRQNPDGSFDRFSLCEGLGRVADVRAADFDGDGDLDLVVGEFGWTTTGKTLLYENAGGSPKPTLIRRDLDGRSGAVHVPVVDLNGDGRPDVVALIGQQHEVVVCFLNEGQFRFSSRDLFRAPHPAWGASGIEPVDIDLDGDIDLLVTNGDSFDDGVLKPDHGVTWLENDGAANFTPHFLVSLPGAHRALAVDADGDGDLDIIACAMAGETAAKTNATKGLPAIVLLEQVSRGKFSSHVLERDNCFHPTLSIADEKGPGPLRFAVGNAYMDVLPGAPPSPSVTIWELRSRTQPQSNRER